MANFSFNFHDPWFDAFGLQVAFRIFTLENTYGPDPDRTEVRHEKHSIHIRARRMFYAGRQKLSEGMMECDIHHKDGRLSFDLNAEHPASIKGSATLIRGFDVRRITNNLWGWITPTKKIGAIDILRSPHAPPLWFLETGHHHPYGFIRSHDIEVRPKRIALVSTNLLGRCIELHHTEDARRFGPRHSAPTWEIGSCDDPAEVIEERMKAMEKHWGLQPWEKRTDVPEWARQIALVVQLHGTHWTGFVFNTFARQLAVLEEICKEIDGRRVLAFLPGWDGRYYWNYPIYKPDPNLGGAKGLRKLVDGAHKLGVHVIPMYGMIAMNINKAKKLNLLDANYQSSYGNWAHGGTTVDWDCDRMADDDWLRANIGHNGFRRHLLDCIARVTDTFHVDGAMLDISQHWQNDSRFSVHEGLRDLHREIHTRHKTFLLFGEGWQDYLMPIFGMFGGTLQDRPFGELENWPQFFHRYCRLTYHLSTCAPGTGSTGVHEGGYGAFSVPDPTRNVIPVLSIVNDTLPKYRPEVSKVIQAAKDYAVRTGI